MRTFRTIGAFGVTAALLLSATSAFAAGRTADTVGVNGERARVRPVVTSAVVASEAERAAAIQARFELEQRRVAERLTDIKDTVKQQMAEQLANQFESLNKTWTDHFANLLDQYTAILQRIQDRANTAASTGQNIGSTTAAIQVAQAAITSARAAVAAQAAKNYGLIASTIPTTATSTPVGQLRIVQALRKSFRTLQATLFKDLFVLRDGPMKEVRKAVQNALMTLSRTPGVGGNSATSTTDGQSNP